MVGTWGKEASLHRVKHGGEIRQVIVVGVVKDWKPGVNVTQEFVDMVRINGERFEVREASPEQKRDYGYDFKTVDMAGNDIV